MITPARYCLLLATVHLIVTHGIEAVRFEVDAVGRNLSCYVCAEVFKDRSYSVGTACQNPVEQVDVIQCGRGARYCKVERLLLHGVMISIERSCADKCFYGCKFNGFGLTYERCTSCCRANGCNTDNGASGLSLSFSSSISLVMGLCTLCRT